MTLQSEALKEKALSVGAAEFAAQIAGEVILPGDPEYDTARAVWNAMIDRRPALIVRPANADDVIAAVNHARVAGMPISIKGGGHNVAGHATCNDAMMLDMSLMRGVEVDPEARVAKVQGGATWGNVDEATQKHGLATPGGLISDTGVAGLTLAGGIGWLRSKHGFSADNVMAFTVVTAKGSVVRAAMDSHPDLYWALRGGGGNFGVVVEFEFALHPCGPTVMFAAPIYPITAGAGPIRFWRDFLADKHDCMGSLVEFSTIPESEDFPEKYWGLRCYTIAALWAGDADEGERVMQPLREQGELAADFSGQMAYCDVQKLFDELFPAGDFRAYWKCHYTPEVSDALIDDALRIAAEAPSDSTLSSIWNMGAETMSVPWDETAIDRRGMAWMYSLDSAWQDPADDEVNISFTRRAWEETRKYSTEGRLYLNFGGHAEEGEKLVREAYGDSYARLSRVKAQYDPTNIFRFNGNVLPASDT
ncbi:FAD-binding oxidoreductase [Pseudoruegeria sp. HB172150]|uniref:FAD-binding oxidoreductase n=1 Tax=Pseudoruegeria sp. HB172150 TaxID=2721164 RepID=UPI00155246B3|nr:FAD-binding oxidoreductase [Pseudoruegeria sp. HB172150]